MSIEGVDARRGKHHRLKKATKGIAFGIGAVALGNAVLSRRQRPLPPLNKQSKQGEAPRSTAARVPPLRNVEGQPGFMDQYRKRYHEWERHFNGPSRTPKVSDTEVHCRNAAQEPRGLMSTALDKCRLSLSNFRQRLQRVGQRENQNDESYSDYESDSDNDSDTDNESDMGSESDTDEENDPDDYDDGMSNTETVCGSPVTQPCEETSEETSIPPPKIEELPPPSSQPQEAPAIVVPATSNQQFAAGDHTENTQYVRYASGELHQPTPDKLNAHHLAIVTQKHDNNNPNHNPWAQDQA